MTTQTSRTVCTYYREGASWFLGQQEGPYGSRIQVTDNVSDYVTKGENLRDWKQRIRTGWNATTSLEGLQRKNSLSNDGSAYASFAQGPTAVTSLFAKFRGCTQDFGLAFPSDPASFQMASVRNKVIQSINSQIRQAHTSLQGMVSAGEFGETVRMINGAGRDLFRKTDKYLKDLSDLARHVTPQNVTRTISRRWLEYSYGIKPTISDIDSYMTALSRYRDTRPPYVRIRAGSESTEKNQPTSSVFSAHRFRISTVAEKSWSYGYKLNGVVGLDDYHSSPLRHEFGITLNEFVPTLWELMPYSFLIDYVTNIGAIIDAYSVNRSSVRWLCQGERRVSRVILTSSMVPDVPSGWVLRDSFVRNSTPVHREWVRVSRGTVGSWVLIPSLEFKIPGTSTKWLNISALAAAHADASIRLRNKTRR